MYINGNLPRTFFASRVASAMIRDLKSSRPSSTSWISAARIAFSSSTTPSSALSFESVADCARHSTVTDAGRFR